METITELIYATISLATMAIGYIYFQRKTSNSATLMEGAYYGHGTDNMGNSIFFEEIRVTALNNKEIEISCPDFPSFKTEINSNYKDVIISRETSRFSVLFNYDIKSLTFEDNSSKISFVGFVK